MGIFFITKIRTNYKEEKSYKRSELNMDIDTLSERSEEEGERETERQAPRQRSRRHSGRKRSMSRERSVAKIRLNTFLPRSILCHLYYDGRRTHMEEEETMRWSDLLLKASLPQILCFRASLK